MADRKHEDFPGGHGTKNGSVLVKTVGALITVIGAALLFAGLAGNVSGSLVLLGSVSAAALGNRRQ